jgi:hypothetical protein
MKFLITFDGVAFNLQNNFKIHGNDFFMTSCKNMNFDWIFCTTVKISESYFSVIAIRG